MRVARLRTAVLVAAVVLAGVGANVLEDRLPPYGETSVRMQLGTDAVVHPFQVHVHGVRVASQVQDGDELLTTSGVWVLLDLSYATVDRPRTMAGLGLRDARGRMFPLSERADWGPWEAGADLWLRGEVLFEVPRDALGEMTLFLWPAGQDVRRPVRYGEMPLFVDSLVVAADEPAVLADAILLGEGER